MSDHKAISFTLNIHEKIRGPGYWKLNISHLENKGYQTEVKKNIQNIKNMEETSIQKWENLKYDVKIFSISFSINSQKKIKGQIRNIEKEISNMETLPY